MPIFTHGADPPAVTPGAGAFGGVDPDLTCRTLEALMDPALSHLGGCGWAQSPAIDSFRFCSPATVYYLAVPSRVWLASYLEDLAIGAGGATLGSVPASSCRVWWWRSPRTKFPLPALHQAEHLSLGDAATVSSEEIRMALLARVANLTQNDAGSDLTDGMGASRLVISMLGLQRAHTSAVSRRQK